MLKRFTRYVTQSVAGMIGISVYVLADTFFISVYSGADGLAVLNLILPVYGLIYAIGAMIGIGSATRYAISRAKGKNTEHYFVQSVTWSILAAVPFMLIGIFIPDKALALLGADAGLIGLGRNYVRIILIATPFFMSNYTFTAFARNDGAPSVAMIGSISGSIFNIIFDYIFMFPVGLGFSGAGLATAICPIVTMSVCTIHYRSSRNHVGFHWKKPSFRHLISCCQLGVSAFVGELSSGVIAIVFNFLILGIAGNMGVAAYGVVANLSIQIRDGGCVENVSYSNIIIETRRFCPDWWGTAEPIVITTFNRDENTKSGTIKNIRFFNVTAKGENGVLIHGNEDNIIENVTFENCSIELTKTSKWQCGLYDLRPCLDYGVESYDNSAFFIRYAKDVNIRKTKTRWGNLCDSYSYAIDAANVENLNLYEFDGKSAKENTDDIKIDRVKLNYKK